MNYNNQTLIAFLRSKGWSEVGQNERFYAFEPPKDFHVQFDESTFYIPIHTENPTYERQMQPIVEMIADLYNIELEDFTDVISTTPEKIRKTG